MKQTIIILMVCVVAVAKGFSADFDYKSVTSNSAQNERVSSERSQTVDSKLNNDFTDVSIQVKNNIADETMDVEVNLTSDKTDSSNKERTEEVRSEMIAGAMGIGIF